MDSIVDSVAQYLNNCCLDSWVLRHIDPVSGYAKIETGTNSVRNWSTLLGLIVRDPSNRACFRFDFRGLNFDSRQDTRSVAAEH